MSKRSRPSAAGITVGLLLATVATAIGVLVIWPQTFGLQTTFPFAQIVPFRLLHILAGLGVLLVTAVIAVALRGGGRQAFAIMAAAVAAVLGFAAIDLTGRGIALHRQPTLAADAIRVISWNTLGNEPGSPTIAQLAVDYDADVLMLPETTEDMGVEIAAQLEQLGKPMQVISGSGAPGYRAAETTLLVSTKLGEYERVDSLGDTAALATVIAEPINGDGPRFIAAHPLAPVPEHLDTWRQDLAWLATVCTDNTILAGDLNATIDHMHGLNTIDGAHLGECSDASVSAGAGAAGTWTSGKPPLLVAAIDHVMFTPQWKVTGFEVVTREDRAGSDHRPVFAELSSVTLTTEG